ncbi:unnamed protein product [Callosobruchus maculatus]|uniref:Uncharacterized protein n=1 Tax=Callosobruchus maculatus TaxID=64391 RepID=A0A653DYA5_CALMS|nr:unnamed protein product [Callosobruchus maculatus]VEN64681.1 unnamed protein product [Callosobruchus maculatus]
MEDKDKKRGPNYTEKKKSTPKYAWPVSFGTESLKKKINSSSILKWFSRSLICLGIPEIIKFSFTHSSSSSSSSSYIIKLFQNKSIFELCLANIEKKLKFFQFDVTLSKA